MKAFRVALLVEENREVGRGLLRGIAQYSRVHGPWIFYRESPFYEKLSTAERLRRIRAWRADGIIMREQGKMDAPLLEIGIPVVFSGHQSGPISGIPNILGDDSQIGIMAAEHLMERGFCHFGFYGFTNMWWSTDRGRSFMGRIRDAGYQVDVYESPMGLKDRFCSMELAGLADWVGSLPRPCAVFASTDDLCQQLAEACNLAKVHVPEEIALLGVDNDELVCEFAHPPLSSVLLNSEKSGYDAAEVLHRMMMGEQIGGITIPIPAPRVVTRQSTDVVAVDDVALAKALRYIRENYRNGIAVAEIATAAGVSRRVLEMRFRDVMQRSVYNEVLRLRMNQACQLLMESNLSIAQVAESLKYDEIKFFSRAFKKITGISPMAYRKQNSVRT